MGVHRQRPDDQNDEEVARVHQHRDPSVTDLFQDGQHDQGEAGAAEGRADDHDEVPGLLRHGGVT